MTNQRHYPLLEKIDSPEDLRQYSPESLVEVASELREFLIHTLSTRGGHFAAGLGTVELTLALHYIFNTPNDRIIWDVGHQTYPHKILTGRRQLLHTIRQKDGLAPFCKPEESPYDAFAAGHSSTSIGIAMGMAIAAAQQNLNRKSIAVIGDGGLSAGMAFEALNHAGHAPYDMLVVLNDNDMSISENVGALNEYFARISANQNSPHIPRGKQRATITELSTAAAGTFFEELGFTYTGPIDGHDLPTLLSTLAKLQQAKGPQFLHVITKKGKGFAPAENDPIKYHGVGQFDPETGRMAPKSPTSPTYTQVFSDWICDMAASHPKINAITPAMREGSGLVEFSQQYPDRYFDVAIAEQHAITLAAGMAADGLQPVVAIYSTFLQRGYDQLIHDIALPKLPVLFAIDRAGVVGPDGPTHAGAFDLSFLRCIPNLIIMAPADENETRQMLYTGIQCQQPAAVRYPRGTGPGVAMSHEMQALPIGKAELRRQGQHIAILAFGAVTTAALQVAEKINATVINMRFVKPLDLAIIEQVAQEHSLLVTIEDNVIAGGAGSAVNEALLSMPLQVNVLNLGLPDANQEHGSREELLEEAGLSPHGIQQSIEKRLGQQPLQAVANRKST